MFLKVIGFLLVLLEVLVIFNLIIVVHELGHFLAARWRGLVIEEFGVWFGKPLWKKKIGGVWYSLGSIPAGGFVKLPQLGNKAVEGEAETEDLPPLAPGDKIIVAFAGPLFSFLLALSLACIIWNVGRPTSEGDETTRIGYVQKGSPAEAAHLQMGDRILSIDGKPVKRWGGPVNSVIWDIMSSEGEKINFLVERDGKEVPIESGWKKDAVSGWRRKSMRQVGIGAWETPVIGKVEAGGAGAEAQLLADDIVRKVNGEPVSTLQQVFERVQKAPAAPLQLTVERGGRSIDATVTPKMIKLDDGTTGPDLGMEWGKTIYRYPNPWEQVQDSVHSIGNMVRALFSAKSDVKAQHFSGPVGIMNLYRRILQSDEGWRMAIVFSVLFNVNLALLNLLPLPVLDGGHILLGFVQLVRRKPMNARFMEYLETGCTVAILCYLLYVTFYDVGDFFPKAKSAVPPAPSATPATPAPAAP